MDSLRSGAWIHAAPLAAVLLFVLVILATLSYLRLEEGRREQEALKRDVEYSQQRLRLRLLEDQEQLLRLTRELASGDASREDFARHAESLVAEHPEMLTISWIDAERQVRASKVRPGTAVQRPWMDGTQLKGRDVEDIFIVARDTKRPFYRTQADVTPPLLELHIPFASLDVPNGALVVEYGLDRLLRYHVPTEVQARYAIALTGAEGQLLAGQAIPPRSGRLSHLLRMDRINQFLSPVTLAGDGLTLRAQAWRTSPGLIGSAVFWLMAGLAAMITWMLIVNWRQSARRQQIQQALLAETSFRRAMENSMLTGMRALDLQGQIIYVNPAFCKMTGWSEQELVGQTQPFSYWPETDHEILIERLAEELAGVLDPSGYEMRVKRKNGSTFDARIYISPLIDAVGKQAGWMAALTDITEPNRVQRQLAASYERFTTVLEALDASVSVAPLGSQELLFANQPYRQWFGDSSDGHLKLLLRGCTVGTSTADEVYDTVDSFVGLPLDTAATSPLAGHTEIYIEHLDKWLEVRSRYLNWVDGRLAQMMIATDITARRQAEEQAAAQTARAEAANRLITMGEMASSVAHELNQPLTAISNYCTGMISRLRSGQMGSDDLLTALDKTARQAQRAGQVIEHIRGFVRRSESSRQPTHVDTLVDHAVELTDPELRRRQVRLVQNVASNLPPILANPILIEQVLINLIRNAAEAIDSAQSPADKRLIELVVAQREIEGSPAVKFSITDSGPGVSDEALARLYEPFFSTKPDGMGIGLNLCRSIVESHQGRIHAERLYNSECILGCRFTFWIPVGSSDKAQTKGGAGSNVRVTA